MSDVPDIYEWADAQHRAERARKAKAPKLPAAPKGTKRKTPEMDNQEAVVEWLRKAGCLTSRNMNEVQSRERDPNKRARFWAKLVKTGCTKGFPDVSAVTMDGLTIYIEMKSAKGKLSPAQEAVHADLRERGAVVVVGRDVWSVQAELAAVGVNLTPKTWRTRRAEPLR